MKKILLLCIFLLTSCAVDNHNQIIMATTTSTENSGLLSYLIPKFEQQHNLKVKIIAVGTGNALKLAKNGDVDIVMVHAPKQEQEFVNSGFGVERQSLMYNHFLIVGPKDNPANILMSDDILIALSKIKQSNQTFISRADNSGTHFKEMSIWKNIGISPRGSWYKEVGQGMGKTLQIASELNAYTLVDNGTWLRLKDKLQLELLYYGDPIMFNPYSIVLVNPKKHPNSNYKLTKTLANWLVSNKTKDIINQYKFNGQQLFFTK